MTEPRPMRRSDREITDRAEILALMDRCQVMYLAMSQGEQPYVLPLNFAYEEREDGLIIYFHGALSGRKADLLRDNPLCCLAMTASYQLIRGEQACQWGAAFASVLAEGRASLIQDEVGRLQALGCLMKRYGYRGEPSFQPEVLQRTALYRVEVQRLSAKARPS